MVGLVAPVGTTGAAVVSSFPCASCAAPRMEGSGGGGGSSVAIAQSLASRYSDWIFEALDELPDRFLITDPCISGHPIVYASRGFLEMSGYSREEVLGRNGRIFQGPATDRRTVIQIREAIREEGDLQVSLLNYRKDGSPHWILFHLCPVFSKPDGQVIHFLAVQVPIEWRRRRRRSLGLAAGNRDGKGIAVGACRWEACAHVEVRCNVSVDSLVDSDNKGLEAEQPCNASDVEKERAVEGANNIISVLTRYSELTGRMVSRRRCNTVSVRPLNSSLIISLGRIKQSFVLSDSRLPDMPIVYASDAFLSLTGYASHEVLGRNIRFLNGSGTDAVALSQIKESIQSAQSCSVRILNYRKDGSSFWNHLHVSPVRNASGKGVSGNHCGDCYSSSIMWWCNATTLLLSNTTLLESSWNCELTLRVAVSSSAMPCAKTTLILSFEGIVGCLEKCNVVLEMVELLVVHRNCIQNSAKN